MDGSVAGGRAGPGGGDVQRDGAPPICGRDGGSARRWRCRCRAPWRSPSGIWRARTWADRLEEVLAHLGAAAAVDSRLRLPEPARPRRPPLDGPARRVGRPRRPDRVRRPDNHLHPYAPDFARWIEVLGGGGVIRRRRAISRARARRRVRRRGLVACSWSRLRRAGVVGVPRVRRLHARSGRGPMWNRRAARGRAARWGSRSAADGGDPPFHRAAVPIDGRARPGDHLHRCAEEHASTIYVSPQVEAVLGYIAAGVARRSRAVAEDYPPR